MELDYINQIDINNNTNTVLEETIKKQELEKQSKILKLKHERLNKIKKKIDTFKKLECIEIYKIIKSSSQKYSQNKNSILFDLMKIDETTIETIEQFINYIENNDIIMEENQKTKNILKLSS